MRSFQNYFFIPLAYIYAAIDKLLSLPPFVYISLFFISCAIATAITFTPHDAAKIRLASSAQSLEDYARFLQHTQASGDRELTQRVYTNIAPLLQQISLEQQREMRERIFPEERVGLLLEFWSSAYALQPNARETNAALAILAYQTFDDEKFAEYVRRWKELEPNDPRLTLFSGE